MSNSEVFAPNKLGRWLGILFFVFSIPVCAYMGSSIALVIAAGNGYTFWFFLFFASLLLLLFIGSLLVGQVLGILYALLDRKVGVSSFISDVLESEQKMELTTKTKVGAYFFGIIATILFLIYGWEAVDAIALKVHHLFVFPLEFTISGVKVDLAHWYSWLTGVLTILFLFLIAGFAFGSISVAIVERIRNRKKFQPSSKKESDK